MPSVLFSFKTLANKELSTDVSPRVTMTPFYSPLSYSSSIYPGDPEEAELDENSSATFTGVIPNVYQVDVFTHKKETTFFILVSNDTSGSVNAADLLLNDWTGSNSGANLKLVAEPATTASFGQSGWIAFGSDYVYIYSASDAVWKRTAISLWNSGSN